MSQSTCAWRTMAAAGTIALLTGCAQSPSQAVVTSNPQAGPDTTWYHIEFGTASHTIDAKGEQTVADVTNQMRKNPGATATIVGKTDTVGGAAYNMQLSHQRADAVRDALVYHSNVDAERVETRWTGETRQDVSTAGNVATEPKRVVDIAIH